MLDSPGEHRSGNSLSMPETIPLISLDFSPDRDSSAEVLLKL